MQFAASGRIVVIAQWLLAVLLPVFVFIGRGFVGAELGWMAVIGIVYGWIIIVLLLVPPVITLFDTEARRNGTVRELYAVFTAIVWFGLLLAGITIPDAGDSGHLPTALTAWTGASEGVSTAVFNAGAGIAVLGWIAAIVAAVMGVVRSRRA